MAKRFTDSEKWEDPFFTNLTNDEKVIWIYLLDHCDNAGVLKINIKNINYFCSTNITVEELFITFQGRLTKISVDTCIINKFCYFQYGPDFLQSNNKAVQSAIKKLLELGIVQLVNNTYILSIPYQYSIDSPKEEVKEEDEVEDEVIDKKEDWNIKQIKNRVEEDCKIPSNVKISIIAIIDGYYTRSQVTLVDENKNHLFSWRLIKTMPNETYTIYNSVLLEKDINGNYNPSKNIFFIVESQNKLSFKNIPKIYEKFDINIAPANNHNYDNSINPNVNNGNSINPILELSMNTIKPDIDVIPSINTIKPSISALPNISEDIIGISNNVTMPKLNMPAMPQIPIATPGMITNLLNNGIGIDYLTSQGMALNSAYRGPSTNIVQTNFSGTSNVYSPFLYYNKGSSEKFIDKLYHPYP